MVLFLAFAFLMRVRFNSYALCMNAIYFAANYPHCLQCENSNDYRIEIVREREGEGER